MLSLTNNININKVNVGYAARIQSDRIQNPDQMTCPLWTGQDLSGRQACPSSFRSKMEGCNSAEDRVFVENSLRPQYTNFVTLSAPGIAGDGLYDMDKNNLLAAGAVAADAGRSMLLGKVPHYGNGIDRVRELTSGRGEVAAANAYANQDRDAALSNHSRLDQRRIIGTQSQKKIDGQRSNIALPNPNGDFTGRSANSQGYSTLRNYP